MQIDANVHDGKSILGFHDQSWPLTNAQQTRSLQGPMKAALRSLQACPIERFADNMEFDSRRLTHNRKANTDPKDAVKF